MEWTLTRIKLCPIFPLKFFDVMQNNGNPKRGAKISPLIYSYIDSILNWTLSILSSVLICKDVQMSTEQPPVEWRLSSGILFVPSTHFFILSLKIKGGRSEDICVSSVCVVWGRRRDWDRNKENGKQANERESLESISLSSKLHCVTLDKLHRISEPHLWNGRISSRVMGLW